MFAVFLLAAQLASAQFTFTNNTPCTVRVLGAFNYNANPCTGSSCSTPWVTVAPYSVAILSPAGVPCYAPIMPPSAAKFIGMKVIVGLSSSTASLCSNPAIPVLDCAGAPRTVQIYDFYNGAIF